MKKSTTPTTIKFLAKETTNRLNQTLSENTTINSFERMVLLSAKAIIDSYEWLLYAVGKTYDVYTILEVQDDFEEALRCAERVIYKVGTNDFVCDTEILSNASKGFTIGNLLFQQNRLKYLIGKVEKINAEAESQCEKAWHEYENSRYWLYFLKKKTT